MPDCIVTKTKITNLNEIDVKILEGKMLVAALAKISTESQTDKTPYEIIEQLNSLIPCMGFDD